jgi:hypothetical protein
MELYGREFTRDELKQRIGHISQIAGIKAYTLKGGRSQGVDALDVKTGSGLNFTVLPGRAMDISWMEHNGRAIGFIAKGGISSAAYYQPHGYEWLRNFNGGLLTTCGLTHVGPPEKDGIWELGLHGRISNIPASEVSYNTKWVDNELVFTVEGKMRETGMFLQNLLLHRKLQAYGGKNKVVLHDEIINEGYEDAPCMILYHMNMGFPLVDQGSQLVAPILHTHARDEEAQKGIERFNQFEAPTPGYKEQVFFHKVAVDNEKNTCVGIVNESMNLGIYIRYNQEELPFFTQWKMMGQQDYVVGLEPGNCVPMGRSAAKEKGVLEILKPGEKKTISLEIGVLTTWEDIQSYKDYVQKLFKLE